MLKVNIYIEKDEFDKFFQWINRLNNGILTTPTISYSADSSKFNQPLQLSIEPQMYHLMKDAEKDLDHLKNEYGEMNVSFEPLSLSWELRVLSDVLRNARRYDLEADLAYTALFTMAEVPGITPSEAMIIAERELITDKEKHSKRKDI